MGRKFKIDRYPFDDELKVYEKGVITFEPGLTVLVGCNGSGKSTLLHMLEERLSKENIPVIMFDTLNSTKNAISNAIYSDNLAFAARNWTASEGERMSLSVCRFAGQLRSFVLSGKNEKSRLRALFDKEKKEITSNERWILIDSADSGLSIDALQEVRNFIDLVIDDGRKNGKEVYIVVSTNQYELAAGNSCLDVQRLIPVTVKTYTRYRQLIINSRKRKDKRDGNR